MSTTQSRALPKKQNSETDLETRKGKERENLFRRKKEERERERELKGEREFVAYFW